jgi:hypothetical protein
MEFKAEKLFASNASPQGTPHHLPGGIHCETEQEDRGNAE